MDSDSYAKIVVADSVDSGVSLDDLYAVGVSESQVVELLRPRRGESGIEHRSEVAS